MKTERISIFNYEAFYLDHLEGNLGVEDTALLMNFLKENPELQLEDDEMPMLFVDDVLLSEMEKNALKQTDDDEVITLLNIDYFLIADAEGILPVDKQNELSDFVELHPEFASDRDQYNALTLSPDLSITYADKNGLKKKTIVLWPYLSIAAAASVLIAFFLLMNANVQDAPHFAKDKRDQQNQRDRGGQKEEEKIFVPLEEVPQIALENKTEENPSKSPNQKSPGPKNLLNTDQFVVVADKKVSPLKKRPARNIVGSMEEFEIQPITTYAVVSPKESSAETDVAYRGFEDMKDPIEPITSILNKRLKTDIDFRTAKASEKKSGGMYIKIGKFEFLHKKRHK